MKTEKRKSAYKEVPADRHACFQFTRGLGTPRTRQLSKSYTTGEMDGRVSAGLCGDSTRCGAMSRSLYVCGKTCHSSSVLFTPIAGLESSSPLTQIQHGFDCCDAQLASEMGHLLPSFAVPNDGSLSPDSFRA